MRDLSRREKFIDFCNAILFVSNSAWNGGGKSEKE